MEWRYERILVRTTTASVVPVRPRIAGARQCCCNAAMLLQASLLLLQARLLLLLFLLLILRLQRFLLFFLTILLIPMLLCCSPPLQRYIIGPLAVFGLLHHCSNERICLIDVRWRATVPHVEYVAKKKERGTTTLIRNGYG